MKRKFYVAVIFAVLVACHITTHSSARIFDRIIAYVNDDVITQRRLDVIVKQRAFELQQIEGYSQHEALNTAEKERATLLDRLIRQKLLVETALTLKIQITDAEIEEQIQKFKTQYQTPSDAAFKKILNREGLTFEAFRERLQRDLMAEKLVIGRILPRLQVRDSDVQKFFEEHRDQLPTKADSIQLRHIVIAFKPTDTAKKNATDIVNQVLKAIQADTSQFQDVTQRTTTRAKAGALIETAPADLRAYPEMFQQTLTKLKAGTISSPIEMDDGIHVFMVETHADEKITWRHFAVQYEISEEVKKIAREKADAIYKKLEAGADYNSLAREHSEDTKTREKGGDLGTHILTALHPKIQKAVKSIETGKYSQPIETDTGITIYKVDERITPELTQQEKQQIIAILRQQRFEKEWTAYTDTLMENAFIKIKPDALKTPEATED